MSLFALMDFIYIYLTLLNYKYLATRNFRLAIQPVAQQHDCLVPLPEDKNLSGTCMDDGKIHIKPKEMAYVIFHQININYKIQVRVSKTKI